MPRRFGAWWIRATCGVLLLEAGGPDTNPAIHDPQRVHELWLAAEDWAYHTVPQAHAANRRLHLPRGRVLGGSSALNGMIWVRGAPADYDNWAYLGNAGWAWEDVLPVFLRAEQSPVHVLKRYERQPIHEAIVAAAVETGIDFNPDYNGERLDGVSYTQLTIRDGKRHGTAPAYLGPILDHPNLSVVTDAHARRLLLDGSRCVGVEWERDGRLEQGRAEIEVIVCTGTIESPRLLMLSGIGPADAPGRAGNRCRGGPAGRWRQPARPPAVAADLHHRDGDRHARSRAAPPAEPSVLAHQPGPSDPGHPADPLQRAAVRALDGGAARGLLVDGGDDPARPAAGRSG